MHFCNFGRKPLHLSLKTQEMLLDFELLHTSIYKYHLRTRLLAWEAQKWNLDVWTPSATSKHRRGEKKSIYCKWPKQQIGADAYC